MKIQDIITLEKKNQKYYLNQLQNNYIKKKGYSWKIPSHSQEESVLLNNYEKDCVIAYVENKYLIIFLIKIMGKDNFKGFVYLKDFIYNISGASSYKINKIYSNKDILKSFKEDEENLKIIENIEYQRFIKLGILESL